MRRIGIVRLAATMSHARMSQFAQRNQAG